MGSSLEGVTMAGGLEESGRAGEPELVLVL